MCQFENKDDNASIFKEHYKSEHPSVAVQCLRVYEMVCTYFRLIELLKNVYP